MACFCGKPAPEKRRTRRTGQEKPDLPEVCRRTEGSEGRRRGNEPPRKRGRQGHGERRSISFREKIPFGFPLSVYVTGGKNDEAEAYFKKEIHALSRKFQNKEDTRLFEELLLQKSEDMKKQVELEQAFPKVETEYKKYKMNLDKQRESEAPKEVEEYFRARNTH